MWQASDYIILVVSAFLPFSCDHYAVIVKTRVFSLCFFFQAPTNRPDAILNIPCIADEGGERDQRLSSRTFLSTTHIPHVVAIIVINVSFANHMKWSETPTAKKSKKTANVYIYRTCDSFGIATHHQCQRWWCLACDESSEKTDENIFHRIFSMNKIAIFHILVSHSWALANGMLSSVWWMVGSRRGVRFAHEMSLAANHADTLERYGYVIIVKQ